MGRQVLKHFSTVKTFWIWGRQDLIKKIKHNKPDVFLKAFASCKVASCSFPPIVVQHVFAGTFCSYPVLMNSAWNTSAHVLDSYKLWIAAFLAVHAKLSVLMIELQESKTFSISLLLFLITNIKISISWDFYHVRTVDFINLYLN